MSNRPTHDPHGDSSGSKPPDEWLENLLRSELNDRASGERPASDMADLAIKRGFRIRRQRRLAIAGAAASILALGGVTSTYAIDALTQSETEDSVADSDEAVSAHDYDIGFVVDDGDSYVLNPANSDESIPVMSAHVDDVIQKEDTFHVFSYGTDGQDSTAEMITADGDSSANSVDTLGYEFVLDDVVLAEHADMAAVPESKHDETNKWVQMIGDGDAISQLPDFVEGENGEPRSQTFIPPGHKLIGWDENSVVLQTDSTWVGELEEEGFIAGGELFDSENLRDLKAFGTEQILVNLDSADFSRTCVVDLAEGERIGGPNADRDACLAEFHSHIDDSDPRFAEGFDFASEVLSTEREIRQRDWDTQGVHNGVSGTLYSNGSEWTVFVPHEGNDWYLQPSGDSDWVPLDVPEGAVAPIDVR